MLRRPTSSAERSASSAAARSRCRTWRALVTWSIAAASHVHEVVDVSRDPPPLGEQRLLSQFAPRRLEFTATCPWRAKARPTTQGKMVPMIQLGTPISASGHGHRHGSGHREQSQRYCRRPRLRPAGNDEGKDGQLEEKRLELSGSLCGGHGTMTARASAGRGTPGR